MSTSLPSFDLTRLRTTYTSPASERAALLSLARSSLSSDRWSDLLVFSREIIRVAAIDTPGADITTEERMCMVQATKQLLSHLRTAWRHISIDALPHDLLDSYKAHLESELLTLCSTICTLLESTLLMRVMSPEPQIFYRKMVGDCYRYLAEVSVPGSAVHAYASGNTTGTPAIILAAAAASSTPSLPITTASTVIPLGYDKKSLDAYQLASRLAHTHLDPTHPTRLGLSLNYSVLLYEINHDRRAAAEIARGAFDAAIAKLDDLEESSYKETTLLMQMLRDNITMWTAQEQTEQQAAASQQQQADAAQQATGTK